jgi:solute carrier family 25 phosphate transporter 3
MSDVHDASYYAKCMVGGIFACGLTHMAVCPLDIVKCRKQANPTMYSSNMDGFKKILAQDGYKGLTVGWAPTLVGYGLQGFGKFGFYELFKDVYKGALGKKADQYQTVGFLVSSACAEVIADTLLCPWEALKVRMQISDRGTFPTSASEGWGKIMKSEGWNGFYKGLGPLWCRQVPYTMVKFGAFENTVKAMYKYIWTGPREQYGKSTQLMITFLSGYWAGIFCAIVSHPADTMVSILNKKADAPGQVTSTGDKVKAIYGEIGFKGLWNGLGTRIIMIGTLTGLQWYIYDSFKVACGLATTGSAPAPKK